MRLLAILYIFTAISSDNIFLLHHSFKSFIDIDYSKGTFSELIKKKYSSQTDALVSFIKFHKKVFQDHKVSESEFGSLLFSLSYGDDSINFNIEILKGVFKELIINDGLVNDLLKRRIHCDDINTPLEILHNLKRQALLLSNIDTINIHGRMLETDRYFKLVKRFLQWMKLGKKYYSRIDKKVYIQILVAFLRYTKESTPDIVNKFRQLIHFYNKQESLPFTTLDSSYEKFVDYHDKLNEIYNILIYYLVDERFVEVEELFKSNEINRGREYISTGEISQDLENLKSFLEKLKILRRSREDQGFYLESF